ncbi:MULTISPECIES: L,D-transpeptidase [Mesorhizobium]|uniref:L,D-transpeptidase n=1 Tax=Mesorhizobium denitrificans TaxID=2294114 RepID=A0A371XDD0_9HYPH|nr:MULTISPECIES: L,D-transpeptidase [Mesorhizobium]RFC67222.1 L,D-transpeptidase [Mesorhizobium denitrificans]
MLSRSLLAMGLGVALMLGAPATLFAQTVKQETTAAITPDPVVKKKVVKKTPSKTKKTAKADTKKGKTKPAKEVAEAPKPKGLFASLFGQPKAKQDDAKTKPSLLKKIDTQGKTKLPPLNPITPIQPVAMTPETSEVLANGNNGELRSEANVAKGGFMASLFGEEDQYLPQTRALDNALRVKEQTKKFRPKPEYEPQVVAFSGYPRGTIVIDTANHFLYLVEGMGSARRYGIAVGKEGLQYKGDVRVGDKQEWPRWIPTKEMQERDPKKYGQYKEGMPGGGENPLGARAIYLYDGNKDTHLRIHGTIAPQSIGTNASNGCFRMINDHVIDLYRRVKVGTNVVVL